ncbi:YvrJ family protein [Cytobacillus kochii]|nr:YvrJ family protein [Cytobacillus kochii]MCM3324807.1 YvrJ family protein [Cytobacillus kochii]MCM3347200.1 YvrJ family protein [Cytobacillus kochii]
MDEFNFWLTALSNFGFPIVIAFYLLIRIERKIDELTKAINELINVTRKK